MRIAMVISIFYMIMMIVLPADDCHADEDTFAPWRFSESVDNGSDGHLLRASNDMPPESLLPSLIRIIYESVSAVDGDRCQMTPTCSAYSLQAIKKHGFVMGIMMTADRLIHEGDEIDLLPVVTRGSKSGYHDSVGDNDFWWHEGIEILDNHE